MKEMLTEEARKVLKLASEEAYRLNHEYIGTEHLLLGLVKDRDGTAADILQNLNIKNKVRLEVEKLIQSGHQLITDQKLPLTPAAKQVIDYAIEEARNSNQNLVEIEHLLLGLLREQDGVAAQILKNFGVKPEDIRTYHS